MFQPVKIAPSILSADFMNLTADVEMMENAGAGSVHVDVMDGHFVPNITMGVVVAEQLVRKGNIPVDVHLMVSNPLDQIPWFVDAGVRHITAHAEALDGDDELARAIDLIHAADARAAVALKPQTPASVIAPVIADLDMVLVMSVEPGFSGQSYIAGTENKIAEVVAMARAAQVAPLIQVDGGIDMESAPLVAAAGADVLVCGNAVFVADDPAVAITAIKDVADESRLAALASA